MFIIIIYDVIYKLKLQNGSIKSYIILFQMSWDQYVNEQLVGTGNVSKAAICGLDGSCWAKSSDWAITPEECKKVADGLANPQNFSMTGEYSFIFFILYKMVV